MSNIDGSKVSLAKTMLFFFTSFFINIGNFLGFFAAMLAVEKLSDLLPSEEKESMLEATLLLLEPEVKPLEDSYVPPLADLTLKSIYDCFNTISIGSYLSRDGFIQLSSTLFAELGDVVVVSLPIFMNLRSAFLMESASPAWRVISSQDLIL